MAESRKTFIKTWKFQNKYKMKFMGSVDSVLNIIDSAEERITSWKVSQKKCTSGSSE